MGPRSFATPTRAVLATIAMAGCCTLAAAQQPQIVCPDEMGIQANMNECAARNYAEADDALNEAWSEARAWATRIDDPARGGPLIEAKPAAQSLLEAQRGWLAYRDGHCAAKWAEENGGSMWPMLYSSCLADLTRVRTQELRELVQPLDGPAGSDLVSPSPEASATGTTVPPTGEATCLFAGVTDAVPCTMLIGSLGLGAGETTDIAWTGPDDAGGERTVHFRGEAEEGWWFGALDGHEATGRELTCGNVVFSSRDRAVRFQYWVSGYGEGCD